MKETRPTGVTVISILSVITGVILIATGIIITLVTPASVATGNGAIIQEETLTPAIAIIALATVPIAIGVAYLATASGLLKGRKWSWSLAQILSMISIVVSAVLILFSGNLLMAGNIAIASAILYYLYTARVKAYFGVQHEIGK